MSRGKIRVRWPADRMAALPGDVTTRRCMRRSRDPPPFYRLLRSLASMTHEVVIPPDRFRLLEVSARPSRSPWAGGTAACPRRFGGRRAKMYGPASSGRLRKSATISSSSRAITDTCDFDSLVTPSCSASFSTRRVETPSS